MAPGEVIYLDHNATTPLDPAVLDEMMPYLSRATGNASSQHSLGRNARQAIDRATSRIAQALAADPAEIVFTSGATESNNLAIRSVPGRGGGHALVLPSEHPSAWEPAQSLAREGWIIESMKLDDDGQAVDLGSSIRPETRLLVMQLANSETGVIQEVEALSTLAPPRCWIHCDATQGVGKIPVRFRQLNVTSLSFSGHKLGGPQGIGGLLVRRDASLRPMFLGGFQQRGLRAGTEPVALIVGLASAIERAANQLEERSNRLRALRDRLESALLNQVGDVHRNGSSERRLPNTTNLSFLGASAEALVINLDLAGVCASAGSACASGAMKASTTLRAMGLDHQRVQSAVRFSVGGSTTPDDVDRAVPRIVDAVARTRLGAILLAEQDPAMT